ncbi:unnamed protein product [Fraxinus pennsylvanica]|uniref:Helicase ATP-binding domain-containing protein n=1 Tax=Fraxinus pennsylvanica TaxID=56036 RepID=A0AAD2DJ77_9LAMI|nr:unnamed protein product [Fraxinus pennsylvanica]
MEENREIEFPAFPYKPYPIQMDFMKFLYQSLDKGGISMLESPTGTGKTLSIICSALQWLVDKKRQESIKGSLGLNLKENLGNESCLDNDTDNEPDWMRNFVPNKESDKREKKKTKEKKKIGVRSKDTCSRKEKEETTRDLSNRGEEKELEGNVDKREGKNMKGEVGIDKEDEEFLLEEYESEEESGGTLKRKNAGPDVCSSSDEEEDGLGDEEDGARLKIYFCSRTHSQLSQFIKELRKTTFASELMFVCLGSRKNFCINDEVLKLGTSTRINERCLELQKSKKNEASKTKNLGAGKRVHRTKASCGCPMLRSRKIEKEFKNEIIQLEPLDIEDLVRIGRNLGTCPYYGSRRMVPAADLVILPYQSLLSKSSRESLGLSLKNSVIIIDEAHNLADTLISMYDAKITVSQLNLLQSHLESYFQRFRNLLGPGNRRYIQTLMVLTQAFLRVLLPNGKLANHVDPLFDSQEIEISFDSSMAINEFLFSLNIDNINLVKLLQYVKESNLTHKVCGYRDKVAVAQKGSSVEDGEATCKEESAVSCFRALADILFSLTNNDGDGRILISRPRLTCHGQEGHIKYVMLTGEKMFSEIADQAHAVVLAGGTLQPIEETKERLFPSLLPDRFHFFSCSHIIPPENILPIVVKHGPSGQSFDFSYKLRSLPNMIEELGLLLCNLVTVVPEGVVVFFSSFDYEGKVYDSWKTSGMLTRIMKKKRVFREPRKNTDVEAVLREYKETIDAVSTSNPTSCNGAILFAVVGGKISEGINFSDGTGRCIVMVGLPYPSPSDIELIERVKHIEGLEESQNPESCVNGEHRNGDVQTGFHILRSCKGRGKEYYENLCMKAVNQSIGRAIRHINDYAAILLVDVRYASDPAQRSFSHSTGKLPQWIKSRLVTKTENYGQVHSLAKVEAENTLLHNSLAWTTYEERQMNKHHRAKVKPQMQMLLKETFYNTKNFFNVTFQNLKSCLLGGYQKPPKIPLVKLIFSTKNPKLHELNNLCKDFSDKNEIPKKMEGRLSPEEEMKGDRKFNGSSMNIVDQSGLKESKEKKTDKYSEGKQVEFISKNTDALAKKMKELEMMDVNDMDHVLDIEEVLNYYSKLTCPAYQDIVDKFFMDMYTEYYLPPPTASVHSSMRKQSSVSVHSSMRKQGSISVHGSMRKQGSISVHGSMRKLGSVSVHCSMRSLGPLKM